MCFSFAPGRILRRLRLPFLALFFPFFLFVRLSRAFLARLSPFSDVVCACLTFFVLFPARAALAPFVPARQEDGERALLQQPRRRRVGASVDTKKKETNKKKEFRTCRHLSRKAAAPSCPVAAPARLRKGLDRLWQPGCYLFLAFLPPSYESAPPRQNKRPDGSAPFLSFFLSSPFVDLSSSYKQAHAAHRATRLFSSPFPSVARASDPRSASRARVSRLPPGHLLSLQK